MLLSLFSSLSFFSSSLLSLSSFSFLLILLLILLPLLLFLLFLFLLLHFCSYFLSWKSEDMRKCYKKKKKKKKERDFQDLASMTRQSEAMKKLLGRNRLVLGSIHLLSSPFGLTRELVSDRSGVFPKLRCLNYSSVKSKLPFRGRWHTFSRTIIITNHHFPW